MTQSRSFPGLLNLTCFLRSLVQECKSKSAKVVSNSLKCPCPSLFSFLNRHARIILDTATGARDISLVSALEGYRRYRFAEAQAGLHRSPSFNTPPATQNFFLDVSSLGSGEGRDAFITGGNGCREVEPV